MRPVVQMSRLSSRRASAGRPSAAVARPSERYNRLRDGQDVLVATFVDPVPPLHGRGCPASALNGRGLRVQVVAPAVHRQLLARVCRTPHRNGASKRDGDVTATRLIIVAAVLAGLTIGIGGYTFVYAK